MEQPATRLYDAAVIGAGMAGLTAARHLQAEGLEVVVLDKGRAVGGRMATRRLGGGRFDHGAQHFSARAEAFRSEVEAWVDAGVARVWFRSQSNTNPGRGMEARHSGADGMRGIPEHLASGLEVRSGVGVQRLDVAAATVGVVAQGMRLEARSVVVTPPLRQTLALLDASHIEPAADLRASLESIEYDATLAVMAILDGESGLADGHASVGDGSIAWIADNHHKGVSPVPAVTIHSSAPFAADHLDDDVARWTAELAAAAAPALGASIVEAQGHRWRYSQPRTTLGSGCAVVGGPVPVILAGEVFAGARVEGAFLSGRAAAARLLELTG